MELEEETIMVFELKKTAWNITEEKSRSPKEGEIKIVKNK